MATAFRSCRRIRRVRRARTQLCSGCGIKRGIRGYCGTSLHCATACSSIAASRWCQSWSCAHFWARAGTGVRAAPAAWATCSPCHTVTAVCTGWCRHAWCNKSSGNTATFDCAGPPSAACWCQIQDCVRRTCRIA